MGVCAKGGLYRDARHGRTGQARRHDNLVARLESLMEAEPLCDRT